MEKQKTIDVLNSLITINNDRIEGYETAANETDEMDLKNIFGKLSATSIKCRQALKTEVTKLGGTPAEGTKTTGKFFRVWMDVKAALTGKNRKAILDSCEYGEDQAVATYNDALKNNLADLSAEQQTMVKSQLATIKADHDHVKGMRDLLIAEH